MTYRTVIDWLTDPDLSKAERDLIDAARAGRKCLIQNDPDTVPDTPDDAHNIRADLLALLITGGTPNCDLLSFGVTLVGAYITGELRLTHQTAMGDTVLINCRFTDQPDFCSARFRLLNLTGGNLPGLYAKMVTVDGSLILNKITAAETVDLAGAKIGGQLACDGATLNGAGHDAFFAQGVTVGEGLFLNKITATGTINLAGAKIGGQLNCKGATLNGAGSDAFFAQGVTVGDDLLLREITATGRVILAGARIGGQLNCTGAKFDGNGKTAFIAQRATVNEAMIWRGVTVKSGRVQLTAAHVGDLWDAVDNWPDDLELDGFTYDRISASNIRTKDRLRWLAKGSFADGPFSPQPHTQLGKVLRDMGHLAEARKILFERQKQQSITTLWDGYRKWDGTYLFPLEKPLKDVQFLARLLLDLILRWLVGYGYDPKRAAIALILLLSLTIFVADKTWTEGAFVPNSDVILVSQSWQDAMARDCIPITPNCIQNPAQLWSNSPNAGMDWESFNQYGYAADLVIPILNLGQTDAWSPSKDRGDWGYFLWWFRWVLIVAGWIVSALGAAAITGIMQRDKDG
jgi:hypothetical protein